MSEQSTSILATSSVPRNSPPSPAQSPSASPTPSPTPSPRDSTSSTTTPAAEVKKSDKIEYIVGEKIKALWTDGKFYNATIKKIDQDKFIVHYTEYGNTTTLPLSSIQKVQQQQPKGNNNNQQQQKPKTKNFR